MTIINGKKIAKRILDEQKSLIITYQLKPKLVTILIGNDEASRIYINEKRKKARKIGVDFQNFHLPADAPQKEIISLIQKLNNDKNVSGMIVQFPIPKIFDADAIVKTIDPKKDVDGFHPENIKKFLDLDNLDDILHKDLLLPVTPSAIIEILNVIAGNQKKICNLGIASSSAPACLALPQGEAGGMHPPRNDVTMIANPSVFTKPLIQYFKSQYQISNIKYRLFVISPDDPNLAKESKKADILITACGKPHFIKANMVKAGAIVIDVGISRVGGKVIGDVDFRDVAPKTSYITPVPGGVGPVTVGILLRNVVYTTLNNKYFLR